MSSFPVIAPHSEGLLEVGDGNRIAWEACGNPEGRPAVVLHGGPGSGRATWARRVFDPEAWRIVLFDQRGCGLSTPHASDPATDLAVNTTMHLIADMERLRDHLGIERWLVFGHSWGCTLGLAYAERHPEQVRALVLVGVTMTRRSEIDWLYRGMAPLFPQEWERFRAGAPEAWRDDLVAAYWRLLQSPDPAVRERAASDWHAWEAASALVRPGGAPPAAWADPRVRMARARLCTHYFHHGGFLDDGAILKGAAALAAIPGAMVHGRLDLEAPLVTAWQLARAWPAGELTVVPTAGHAASDTGMTEAILAATERFAREG